MRGREEGRGELGMGGDYGSNYETERQIERTSINFITNTLASLTAPRYARCRHLRKDGNFDESFGRETPHVLHSNTQVSIQELRKQLAMSERGLEQLNAEVKKGVQWVRLYEERSDEH